MDNINKHKPESIFEHIRRDWFLKQTLQEDYIDSGTCYEYYYAFGAYYKPKSILEIGVLYGYSAASLILGAHQNIELFDGWDIDFSMDIRSGDSFGVVSSDPSCLALFGL